jgi:hypothetical protein
LTTQTNTVINRYKSEGANKVVKDTERVGKAQTRLGQASASSGRQFSAQAAGLGGLVGAYAGAAANIFAITAAFTALNRAARAEQTIDGLNRLAATFGQVGSEVISNLQDITKGQLSVVQTAQQANIALSAGLGPQLEGLTAVSLKASRALGRNLTDAFQRIVRGAGKLEPELLDELGIFARLDPAVEKYALQTGKTASSLTNFERRQAFANAVLEEGARKFATINTTVPTTAEKLERLSATIANIGQQLGSFLADFLAPVAEFISNNLSAAVIAIGLLLRQLFGRALAGAATAFDGFISKVSGGLSSLALNAQTNNQAFQKATSEIAQSSNKISPGTLFGGKQAAEGVKVLKFLREGGTISPADAKASAAALREAADAQTKFVKRSDEANARAKTQKVLLNGLAREVDNLSTRTNLYGAAATTVFNGVNAVALKLKTTISTLLVFGNRILIFVGIVEGVLAVVGQIFGKALSPIAFLSKLIRDSNAEAKRFNGTLAEVASTISLTVETAGLLPKQLEEATKKAGESLQDVFNVSYLEAPITAFGNTLENIISLQSDLNDASVKTAQVTIELSAAIADATERTKKFGTEGRQAFVELQILEKVESLITSFGVQGASAFELLNQLAARTGIAAGELFGLFSAGLISVDSQTKNFAITFQGLTLEIANAKGELFAFTQVADAAIVGVIQNFKSFSEEFARGALTAEGAGQRIVAVETQLARVRSELDTQILGDISKVTQEDLKRIETQEELLVLLEKQLYTYSAIKDELVTLEKLQKDIKSSVSGDIKEFERAALSGIVGPGGISQDQLSATKNQLQLQQSILSSTNATLEKQKEAVAPQKAQLETLQKQREEQLAAVKDIVKAQAEGNLVVLQTVNGLTQTVSIEEAHERAVRDVNKTKQKIDAITTSIAEKDSEIATKQAIINDLASARLGSIIKLNDETTKLARAQEKARKAAEDELKFLILRNSLNQKNRELTQAKASDAAFIDGLSNELSINKALAQLAETQNSLAVKKREISSNELANIVKQAQASKELLSIQSKLAQERITKGFSQQIAPIAKELADLEFFSNLATEEQRRQLREQIILLERDQQLAILEAKKKQAAEEFQLNLVVVNAQIAAAGKALQAAKEDKAALEERQRTELNLFDQRKELERQQAQREINRVQDQRDVFVLEKQISDTQAKIQLDRKLESINNIRRELAVIKERALTNDAFLKGQANILQKYVEVVNAQLKATGLEDLGISINTADFEKASADTLKRIGVITTDLQIQQNRAEDIFSEQLAESQAVKEAREQLNKTEERRLQANLESNSQLADIERKLLLTKQEVASADSQLAIENATARLDSLKDQKQQLLDKRDLDQEVYANERAQIIQNAQEKLDILARERDTMMKIKNIAAGVVIDHVTNAFMDLNTALIEGNLTFKNIAKGFRDMLGSMLREIQSAVFRQTIAAPIAEFVGGLFAAGGRVHLAGGGSMKRDRVAAMLEPGEYVIRKEAAKKLGMSKLQELNAGVSDDPIARVIAYAYGSKVKRAAGGSINDPTIEDLQDTYGKGSRGVDPFSFVPYLGNVMRLMGVSSGTRIGATAAPALTGRTADQFAQVSTRADGTQLTRLAGYQPGDYIPGRSDAYMSSAGRGLVESPFGTGQQFSALTPQGTPYFSGFGAFKDAVLDGPGLSVPAFGATERFAAANRGVFGQSPTRDSVQGRGPAGAQIGGAGGGYGGIRATGGMIRAMAGGGAVMSRDRVPALLEPGEFVIRRPAAKAIGGAALGAMNATGKAPSISVNVNNQGAPKTVAVAPPKMNGDKVILDIITRDLRNNGSIKKSLRRGK